MSEDTCEFIIKKLCCQPIFSYILSWVIARNVRFSQSLSHMYNVCVWIKNYTNYSHFHKERHEETDCRHTQKHSKHPVLQEEVCLM